MKRNIVWALFFVALFSMSLAAVAKEHSKYGSDSACTPSMVMGTWGYSETGTVYISGVATPYVSMGTYILSYQGKVTGARTAFWGSDPTPRKAIIKGTATVNADCTGTETLYFYSDTGTLTGYAFKNVVYINNAREARKLVVPDMTIPGMVPALLITDAKKMFPDDSWMEEP